MKQDVKSQKVELNIGIKKKENTLKVLLSIYKVGVRGDCSGTPRFN